MNSQTEHAKNSHEREVYGPLNECGERGEASPVQMEEGRAAREQEYEPLLYESQETFP